MFHRINQIMCSAFFAAALFMTGSGFAGLVTNGGFEMSEEGELPSSGITGWSTYVADDVDPRPEFEIVSDPVHEGDRAMQVSVNAVGANQWNIQLVADNVPIEKGHTYMFSAYAKSEAPGAKVNFTVGNLSYSEIGAIRPANLTAEWQQFTLPFSITEDIDFVRLPIHFNYEENIGNTIYIDHVQITDVDFGKTPVVAEAENVLLETDLFDIQEDNDVTYITPIANFTGSTHPEDPDRVIVFDLSFQEAGLYNLFLRVRVGPGTYDDDSFFYGNGFGEKDETAAADWTLINGLASGGFASPFEYVHGPGALGSEIWKWIVVTADDDQNPFLVPEDNLNQAFCLASREDGLDIDKIAFGRAELFYTVHHIDNGLAGSVSMDTTLGVYPGPQIGAGQSKFLGCAKGRAEDASFANYWNQLTPGNAGKWASVGRAPDSTNWNWDELDNAYQLAKDNELLFKNHTLIWGNQQPNWISDLAADEQLKYITTWIKMTGERYPEIDMIDVVNEPLLSHNPPDGGNGRADYKEALGGDGETGWDWAIKSFELARKYLPGVELHLNDYNILNSESNTAKYLEIIQLLMDRGLIDGIGVQSHRFSLENASTVIIQRNLDRLAETGLPVYISELDLGNIGNTGDADDAEQLELYQRIFPVLWEHPGVKGITLWGYREGQMWQESCYLVRFDGTWRPALEWLVEYLDEYNTSVHHNAEVIPTVFSLEQNYPNPFNPETRIAYHIGEKSRVKLAVFDMLGREKKVLVNEFQLPGQHAVSFNGHGMPSGVYFYRLDAGTFSKTRKFVLIQ